MTQRFCCVRRATRGMFRDCIAAMRWIYNGLHLDVPLIIKQTFLFWTSFGALLAWLFIAYGIHCWLNTSDIIDGCLICLGFPIFFMGLSFGGNYMECKHWI